MGLNRVFIVGAGISKGAGLPMRYEFFHYENRAIKWIIPREEQRNIEHIRDYLTQHKKNLSIKEISDIEKVWDGVLDLEKPTKDYYENILKDLLVRKIIFCVDNYFSAGKSEEMKMHKKYVNDFLKSLYKHKDTIITLNYDTILEETYGRDKFWFGTDLFLNWSKDEMVSRPFMEEGKIRLFKLHGSINWLYCDKCKQIKYLGRYELIQPYASGNFYCHKCAGFYTFSKTYTMFEKSKLAENGEMLSPIEIVALPMNREKYSPKYKLKVEKIWDNAKKELENANEIIIIGYASIDIDKYVRDLIINAIQNNKNKDTLKIKVICLDKDGSIRKNYEDVFQKIDYKDNTFEEFVRTRCTNAN